MMIDLARGVSRASATYRSGGTPPPEGGFQLNGATLSIVGYRRIARRLTAIARGVAMTVLAHDPHVAITDPGIAQEARARQYMDSVRQVIALSAGRMPDGAINPDAAHRLARLRPRMNHAGGTRT